MQVGRPPKYSTPEQMQVDIDAYFETGCDGFPTVTGLALALDMTRKTLMEYEEEPEFGNTVKKAKARVEAFIERRLYEANATGCIFNLKNNFGWRDKTETEHSGGLDITKITRKIVD